MVHHNLSKNQKTWQHPAFSSSSTIEHSFASPLFHQ